MKKFLLTACAVFGFVFVDAQEQVLKSKLLIEVNTQFGGTGNIGGTGIGFRSTTDVGSVYNIGVEGGYFLIDNLALKAGLGYGGDSPKVGDSSSAFTYKIGAKYYIISMIPVEVAYNGISVSNKPSGVKDPSFISAGLGYALFLGNNVSIEPGLRYNHSLLSKDDGGASQIQFNVGFALHF